MLKCSVNKATQSNHRTFFQVHQKKYFQRGDRETVNTIERWKLDMSIFSRKSEGITARRWRNFLRSDTENLRNIKISLKKNQGEIWRNTENNEKTTKYRKIQTGMKYR